MRKKTLIKRNKKQLIYRKDGPIPPPIKIGGPPWVTCMERKMNEQET